MADEKLDESKDRDHKELVELIQSTTEKTVVESVLNRMGDRIYRFIQRSTHTDRNTDDIYQDFCEQLLADPGALLKADSPRGFLYTIAARSIANYYRKSANNPSKHVPLSSSNDVPVPPKSSMGFSQKRKLNTLIEEFYAKAGDRARTIINLRRDDVPFPEIQRILEAHGFEAVSSNALRMEYNRLMDELKILAEKANIDPPKK